MTTKVMNLVKRFGDFEALKQINFDIKDGEFVAILGPSGCGKTTLLRLLAGFDSPSDGNVWIGEKEVGNSRMTIPPEKRNIGMVFQSFALWPHMTVEDHIKFPLLHQPFVPAEMKKDWKNRVEQVLEMVELTDWKKRMPSQLSGGQKQRVALARAIAPKPDLLLMDEPLSSLDAELRMEMRREIQELHRLTKATIVYVTHDQSEALAMADRIVVMNKGQIEQMGTPQEVYSRPNTPFVASFVGKANLVKGTWNGDIFSPALADGVSWPDLGVSDSLKAEHLYPLRPEQLEMTQQPDGLPGIIASVQYQGKEIHYTVQLQGETWNVHTGISESYRLGEHVFVRIKAGKSAIPERELASAVSS